MFEHLPVTIHNYKFISLLGSGTYSAVYKVVSLKYNTEFAAKISLNDSTVISENGDIIDSEFNALKDLDHPNIIRIFDKFFFEDYFVLVLEYLPGGTVHDLINQNKLFTVQEIKIIGSGLLNGLALCHRHMFAHRDIKPSNIFIDAYNRYKLADFNLCSMLKQEVKNACGSLPYVSPEVLGNDAYDPFKADIWALGVTFYQMVSGKLPWTDEEILSGKRSPLSFPPKFPSDLEQIIRSMLDIDPSKRPTATELSLDNFFTTIKVPSRSQRVFSVDNFDSNSVLRTSSMLTVVKNRNKDNQSVLHRPRHLTFKMPGNFKY